jgi:tetrathionate reductase subunit B
MAQRRLAIVIDSRKCINCKPCSVACRAQHAVPLGHTRNWLNEETRGTFPRLMATSEPEQCHHCEHPACVRVCPTGALTQSDFAAPEVDQEKCIACGKCVRFCPKQALKLVEER